jgi:hypothetical protein
MKDIESLKNLVLEHASLGDLLQREGRITGFLDEEQFSCPFHGHDRKKSSRYYRSTETAYCWVCKEKWDFISYIRKKEGIGFSEAINRIVKDYNIDISVLPEATEEHVTKLQEKVESKVDNRKLALEKVYQAITTIKDEVKPELYIKFVYAYMVLKYIITDDNFEKQLVIVKSGILKVLENMRRC